VGDAFPVRPTYAKKKKEEVWWCLTDRGKRSQRFISWRKKSSAVAQAREIEKGVADVLSKRKEGAQGETRLSQTS